jgi:thiamine biosynthesis lipoprotein
MASFRAMNTEVTVVAPTLQLVAEAELAARVERVFAQAERTFSRFRSDSELARLNQADGPSVVSPTLFAALERARRYWALTEGWFDPTIGRALCAAGYDRSFAPGMLDRPESTATHPLAGSFGDVGLDSTSRQATLPAECSLDGGGFIKGWTVDLAARLLPSLAAVDAGGDAVVRGHGVDGVGWPVDVEDPFRPGRALMTLRLRDQAVATSGANRRRWRVGIGEAHHLIDPHTGQPANTDLVQVTVVAPSAELADVLAKVAFLRGFADGRRFLERFTGVAGVFVRADGRTRLVGDLEVANAE